VIQKKVDWQTFHRDCLRLAELIKAGGENYRRLICISRGGLVVGAVLGHILNFRNISTVGMLLYDDTASRSDVEIITSPDLPSPGSSLLVVDDLVDSGRTLAYLSEAWGKRYRLHFAVLYDKGGGAIRPTFRVEDQPEVWIHFPWEDTASELSLPPESPASGL
jgi:xanthine phosphoribosyltransferase